MNNNPNLFHFATKELSQDAFLCWLLKWSEKQFQKENPKLHASAKNLLADFIEVEPDALEIETIEIKPQFKNIDIVLYFNDYVVAIEDKIRAEIGNDQLKTYATKLEKLAKGDKKKVGIFLKSFVIRNDELKKAKDARFKVYDLVKLREVLSIVEGANNDIFNDFRFHLDSLYRDIYEFDQKPIGKEWNADNYYGLSLYLKKTLDIPYDFGTFRKGDAFWFRIYTKKLAGLPDLCLEIKEGSLVIKSTVKAQQYADLMRAIHSQFLPQDNRLKRKNKKGKHLTLYRFPQLLIEQKNTLLDKDLTVEHIKSIVAKLNSIK